MFCAGDCNISIGKVYNGLNGRYDYYIGGTMEKGEFCASGSASDGAGKYETLSFEPLLAARGLLDSIDEFALLSIDVYLLVGCDRCLAAYWNSI